MACGRSTWCFSLAPNTNITCNAFTKCAQCALPQQSACQLCNHILHFINLV